MFDRLTEAQIEPAEMCIRDRKTRYSRFPLCERGDLDKTLGVVHIKDLYALRDKVRTGADLSLIHILIAVKMN